MNTELLIPSAEELAACNASMKVSAIDANDFPDWEARLSDSKNDPRPHSRRTHQRKRKDQHRERRQPETGKRRRKARRRRDFS